MGQYQFHKREDKILRRKEKLGRAVRSLPRRLIRINNFIPLVVICSTAIGGQVDFENLRLGGTSPAIYLRFEKSRRNFPMLQDEERKLLYEILSDKSEHLCLVRGRYFAAESDFRNERLRFEIRPTASFPFDRRVSWDNGCWKSNELLAYLGFRSAENRLLALKSEYADCVIDIESVMENYSGLRKMTVDQRWMWLAENPPDTKFVLIKSLIRDESETEKYIRSKFCSVSGLDLAHARELLDVAKTEGLSGKAIRELADYGVRVLRLVEEAAGSFEDSETRVRLKALARDLREKYTFARGAAIVVLEGIGNSTSVELLKLMAEEPLSDIERAEALGAVSRIKVRSADGIPQ